MRYMNTQHTRNWGRAVALAGFLISGFAGLSLEKAQATDLEMAKYVEKIKVSGDFRLRNESFFYNEKATTRTRERYRLRLGVEVPIGSELLGKFQFASGTGEQVSTNQTFDNLGSQKAIFTDLAYLQYTPMFGSMKPVTLTSGRMKNSLWRVNSSDIVWDDDFNPEGFAENVEYRIGPVKVFANGLQSILKEVAATGKDPYLLSNQVGAEFRLPLDARLRIAGANHAWVNKTRVSYAPNAGQDGNRYTTADNKGILVNDFYVNELTGQLSLWTPFFTSIPINIQGTFIKNEHAKETLSPLANQGHQVGIIVGKAAMANSVEAAYFFKRSEGDSTVANVADSDFGNGGTNRRGHILWIAYNPQDYLQVKAKYFQTAQLDRSGTFVGSSANYDINRLQVDLSVKF